MAPTMRLKHVQAADAAEAMATVFNENIAMAISKSTNTLAAME